MKILVACEESQAVTIELRKLGHEAYSCDIEPCSGGHPEWHIQYNAIPLLNPGRFMFNTTPTQDGKDLWLPDKWDMIIAFPPCTYLTNAGTRHYSLRITPEDKVISRINERNKAARFFMLFANADCEKIAIENPVGYMNGYWRKSDQILHPYYFAKDEDDTENYYKKRTCLWLKGLPILARSSVLIEPKPMYFCKGEKCNGKAIGWCEGMRNIKGGQKERAKARSKTPPGLAKAMAEQWAGEV